MCVAGINMAVCINDVYIKNTGFAGEIHMQSVEACMCTIVGAYVRSLNFWGG